MAKPSKLLSTRYLLSDDVAKAADEAFRNARRLIQAGQFAIAHRILAAMLVPGPWRTSKQSDWRYHLLWHVWWLEGRLGAVPVLDAQAEAAEPHGAEVRKHLNLVVPPSVQAKNFFDEVFAGRSGDAQAVTWSAHKLAEIFATVRPDKYGPRWVDFRMAAEIELRRRVRERVLGRGTDPLDHGAIADTIERSVAVAYPRDVAKSSDPIATSAAVLDVLAGDTAAAVARLGRIWPKTLSEHLPEVWRIPAFGDFLASGVLGPALGIDDASAEAYLEAFNSRTPHTVAAAVTKPKPWKQVLKDWVARTREEGHDAESLRYAVEQGTPVSKLLLARAKKGEPLNVPAKETDVVALEARIGHALPPSYREFLLTADGLALPNFLALLPAAQVGWLHEIDPDTVTGWNSSEDDAATDEQYAIYGADQDCIHMRPTHLRQALMISTHLDGDVLLLVPAVRFGDEWEAWFLGAKNPGAYRFRSFRALMEQKLLADE